MVDKYTVWLDDVNNHDVGVVLQGPLQVSAPEPEVETVSVPGRNGNLHIYTGSFKNRSGSFGAYLYRKEDVKHALGSVQNWLLGVQGYRRISDGEDIDHYWLGRVVNGAEVAARMNRIAPFTVKLDLKPQHFLASGDEAIELTESGTVYNPTIFASKPLYIVKGSGDVTITVNGQAMQFTGLGTYIYSDTIYFDTDSGAAYTPDATDTAANSRTNALGNYDLVGGTNEITIEGDVSLLQIIPRWWEL